MTAVISVSTAPTQSEDVRRALCSSRLFRGLDPAFLGSLSPHASIVRLSRGEQLWRCGEPAEHVHVVLRGVLELQRRKSGPESTLIALFGPGESPAIPATLERKTFIADALSATRETEILRVRARPILDELPVNSTLAAAMNRVLLDHSRLLHAKIDVLVAGTVPQRVAAFFLDLVERFGDEHVDGRHHVPLALSRQQIATYVGARVETVIRCCSAWQKSGLLETHREGFVISSPAELRRMQDGRVSSFD